MTADTLHKAVCQVPPGRWALAISGGADSVALLRLIHERHDIESVVVHLNHQARGIESDADAEFVGALSAQLGHVCHIARRDQIEPTLTAVPKNRSARFRAMRLALFRSIVKREKLSGVILAHHADDQAETVLSRLLRGSGYTGLAGMLPRASVCGLMILRPLLDVRREMLRKYLRSIGQAWREDLSNRSPQYARNRIRCALSGHDELTDALCQLAGSCGQLRNWVRDVSPRLEDEFVASTLARLPGILADESARRWLRGRGVPEDELSPRIVAELIEMAADAATPARRDFPRGVRVRRRRGIISVA